MIVWMAAPVAESQGPLYVLTSGVNSGRARNKCWYSSVRLKSVSQEFS